MLLVARRPGDQLVVTKLDRLGRSLEHLIELSGQMQDHGVERWLHQARVSRVAATPPRWGNHP